MTLLLNSFKSSYAFMKQCYLLFIILLLIEALYISFSLFIPESVLSHFVSFMHFLAYIYLIYRYKIFADNTKPDATTQFKETVKRIFVIPFAAIFQVLIAAIFISIGVISLSSTGFFNNLDLLENSSHNFDKTIVTIIDNFTVGHYLICAVFTIFFMIFINYLWIAYAAAILQKDYFYLKSFFRIIKIIMFKEVLTLFLFEIISLVLFVIYLGIMLGLGYFTESSGSSTISLYVIILLEYLIALPILILGYFSYNIFSAISYTLIKRKELN